MLRLRTLLRFPNLRIFLRGVGQYLLDVVVAEGTAILELLAGENQTLLIGWDAFFVLNLGLDIVDRVARFHLESNGFTRQGLDKASEQ